MSGTVVFNKPNGWTEIVDAEAVLRSGQLASEVAAAHHISVAELRSRARLGQKGLSVVETSRAKPLANVEALRAASATPAVRPSSDEARSRLQRIFGWQR